jgi:hypothetical protein
VEIACELSWAHFLLHKTRLSTAEVTWCPMRGEIHYVPFSTKVWRESDHVLYEYIVPTFARIDSEISRRSQNGRCFKRESTRLECVQFWFLARSRWSWLKSFRPLSRVTGYFGVTTDSQVAVHGHCNISSVYSRRRKGFSYFSTTSSPELGLCYPVDTGGETAGACNQCRSEE